MRGAHDYSHDDRKSRSSSRTRDNKARFYSYCARHKDERSIRLRLYFKGKQAKKKGFSVSMDASAVNRKYGKPLLIWFRRKTVYEYVPLFTH